MRLSGAEDSTGIFIKSTTIYRLPYKVNILSKEMYLLIYSLYDCLCIIYLFVGYFTYD